MYIDNAGRLTLPQSYDPAFARLLEDLWRKYPPEVFKLEGVHPDQLDMDKVSRGFFKRGDSATADKSIDPNANVIGRDVITYNYEVPKALMKLNSLYNLWRIIKEKHAPDLADSCIEAEISGELYINDAWDIGRPYCFNYSTYDIALEGLKMGGRLTVDPPKSLHSFLRQVEQFTVYAANSTLGATGLHEALEIMGYDMAAPEGLKTAEEILDCINKVNETYARYFNAPHNMEQVPAESSSVKLAAKDSILGYNPEGYELYSNQFLPLWLPGVDLLDRIKVQGALDKHCTGGAILHLNIGEAIHSTETMRALITHAVESGVVYFAINYQINRCVDGHMTVGRAGSCPSCGREITDTFTRVVGFLTNTKHWHRTRRIHDWPNRQFINTIEE